MRRRSLIDQALADLARAHTHADIGDIAVPALKQLVRARDDFVLTILEPEADLYHVLGASAPGTHTPSGHIATHPVLSSMERLDRRTTINARDRRQRPELLRAMEAGNLRRILYVPIVDPQMEVQGCLIVLSRHRWQRISTAMDELVGAIGAAAQTVRLRILLERAQAAQQQAAHSLETALDSIRLLDASSTIEAIMGEVLRRVRFLDEGLIGAVVGVVADRVVSEVAAIGATPRSAIEATRGTRLDGFPIGRQLLAERSAIFARLEEVSHVTRSKIMDPLGARSLLAASGRAGGTVRIVLSAYRPQGDPPASWTMAAIETVLDAAAEAVGRIELRTWLGKISERVQEGVVVLDARGHVLHCNEQAKGLLPQCDEGTRFPFAEYEMPEGGPVAGPGDPFDTAVGEDREGVLRVRSTGALHTIRVSRLAPGGRILVLSEVPDAAVSTEPDQVLDLNERRARRTP